MEKISFPQGPRKVHFRGSDFDLLQFYKNNFFYTTKIHPTNRHFHIFFPRKIIYRMRHFSLILNRLEEIDENPYPSSLPSLLYLFAFQTINQYLFTELFRFKVILSNLIV